MEKKKNNAVEKVENVAENNSAKKAKTPAKKKTVKKSTSSDNRWGQILFNAIFIGLVCAFVGSSFSDIRGGSFTSIIVIIVSAISMGICDYFAKHKNQKWLESFSLSISMIVGMSMAVIIG